MKLSVQDVSIGDYLRDVHKYVDITGEYKNRKGELVICGTVGDVINDCYFKVSVSRWGVKVHGGSLCKYYNGTNLVTLSQDDYRKAVQKLSRELRLPMDKASITCLDFGHNFIVDNPATVYFDHLGELSNYKRLPYTESCREVEGLMYVQSKKRLVFYNKIKQLKRSLSKHNSKQRLDNLSELHNYEAGILTIPKKYQGKYVLRYEQRYVSRLKEIFGGRQITVEMLYNKDFWNELVDHWHDKYFEIRKINDVTLNFDYAKGKKGLYVLGLLALTELSGGELSIYNKITDAQKSGKLTNTQACRMREVFQEAHKENVCVTVKNECILELDKKVRKAWEFYRCSTKVVATEPSTTRIEVPSNEYIDTDRWSDIPEQRSQASFSKRIKYPVITKQQVFITIKAIRRNKRFVVPNTALSSLPNGIRLARSDVCE
jgi:hypothetical protein